MRGGCGDEWYDDDDGEVVMWWSAVVVSVGVARGGEWYSGSDRSGGEEGFGARPESFPVAGWWRWWSTAQIPPPVTPIPISEPDVPKTLPKTTPIPEPDVPKNLPKPHIPYPSRLNQEKSRDKASNRKEKIFQMFQDLRFDISFADALLLMPRFAPTIKSLLINKEKLLELAYDYR
ncbi:hypothetical protein Tco_1411053 [Tanacetum coccineum]